MRQSFVVRAALPQRMRSGRGQSLIEFALSAAMLFILIIGTLWMSHVVWQYNLVSNLAQEGARWASVRGLFGATPASAEDVSDFVLSRALGLPVTVATAPVPSTLRSGDVVTVTVERTVELSIPFVPPMTLPLRSSAQMIMAR